MTDTCPHCGTGLPAIRDAFCPSCRNSLDGEPVAGVATIKAMTGAPTTTAASVSAQSNRTAKFSADGAFGLLAGSLFGLGVAMIWVEPYWITPDSKARLYVAASGVLGASGVCIVRGWFHRKAKQSDTRALQSVIRD